MVTLCDTHWPCNGHGFSRRCAVMRVTAQCKQRMNWSDSDWPDVFLVFFIFLPASAIALNNSFSVYPHLVCHFIISRLDMKCHSQSEPRSGQPGYIVAHNVWIKESHSSLLLFQFILWPGFNFLYIFIIYYWAWSKRINKKKIGMTFCSPWTA
jgi:hypothetical protein